MRSKISIVLLSLAAGLLAFDGIMHGLLWGRSGVGAIQRATLSAAPGARPALPSVFAGELQVLWMADVVNLVAVALVCALAAFSPRFASPPVLIILASLPATLAVLLYMVGGPYYVAHMQAVAAALIVGGAAFRFGQRARAG